MDRSIELFRRLASWRWVGADAQGEVEGRRWMAGELVPGVPLSRILEVLSSQPRRIPEAVAAGIGGALLAALSDVRQSLGPHAEPVLMRVHPSTVRIGWDGTVRACFPLLAWMFDLDVLRLPLETISPELAGGLPIGAPSDAFQVASMVSWLVSGRSAFAHPQKVGLLQATLISDYHPLPAELSPGLTAALEGMLHQRPAERSSVEEFTEQLVAVGSEAGAARWLSHELPALLPRELAVQRLALGVLEGRPAEELPATSEQHLLDARDDEGQWLVLADWMQANGNPRGELAILQQRRRGPRPEAIGLLEPDEQERIERDGLAPPLPTMVLLYWRYGYVHTAWVSRRVSQPELEAVLNHPSLRFLVSIGASELSAAKVVVDALRKTAHPAVQWVLVPGGARAGTEKLLTGRLPRLRRVLAGSLEMTSDLATLLAPRR